MGKRKRRGGGGGGGEARRGAGRRVWGSGDANAVRRRCRGGGGGGEERKIQGLKTRPSPGSSARPCFASPRLCSYMQVHIFRPILFRPICLISVLENY